MLARTLAAIVFVALFAGNALAQSQPPVPAPGERGGPPQEKIAPQEQYSTPGQRGTEQAPFVIKIETEHNDAHKDRAGEEDDPQSAVERRLTSYTGWMAVLTGFLFVATLFQALVVFFQLRGTRSELRNRSRAHLRPSFPDLIEPDSPQWLVHVKAVNWGPAVCVLTKIVAKFKDEMPSPSDFVVTPTEAECKETATLLGPSQSFDHTFTSPSVKDGQFCYGYFRWNDEIGAWQYRFCMRVWSKDRRPPKHDHFHQTGKEGYNGEERDPGSVRCPWYKFRLKCRVA